MGNFVSAVLILASVMTWDPSPSPDASNCYFMQTLKRTVGRGSPPTSTWDFAYVTRYSAYICGPPFAWTLPPDPEPGSVQFFCLRAKDLSNNYSVCADPIFQKPGGNLFG